MRQQLSDQLKCLDVRVESHVTMLGELQDFYRRRSEVELEYSRGIDKLVKQIMARHKTDKHKSVKRARRSHQRAPQTAPRSHCKPAACLDVPRRGLINAGTFSEIPPQYIPWSDFAINRNTALV